MSENQTRKAVILAGGLGSRLEPFTRIIPKPLLPIGESSVMEIQLECIKKHNITEIFIATNYRAEYVEAFLGDGSKYGVDLHFSKEDIPLGTCGPVLLLRDKLDLPFLLMNGDVLTTLNFSDLFDFAESTDANLVVCTKIISTPFSFGKVYSENGFITKIEEKPDLSLEILAGIYILKPGLFDIIPSNTYYGIDSLIKDMLDRKMKVAKYLIKEYWIDIGRENDYNTVQADYEAHFKGDEKNID